MDGLVYDIKYRQCAVEHWSEGSSQRQTAALFKVAPSTLQRWKTQLKKTGTLAPKKRRETWRKIEPEALHRYVAEHPDAYLREIAAAFHCTIHAVEGAMKRLKITRKKKTTLYRERNESIRCSFQKTLAEIPEDKRVYTEKTRFYSFNK